MRAIATRLLLLAAVLFVFGCGDNNSPNVNGNWVATTTSNAGGQALTITFAMQEGTANGNTAPVTFSNFTFTPTNSCFDNTANASGTITEPVQAGATRNMTVDLFSGAGGTGNHAVLTLTIDPSNNAMNGTYSLTGTVNACNSDNGSIIVNRQ